MEPVRAIPKRSTKASRPFQIFVKPAGAACNLDCSYCYYLKKQHLFPASGSFRMADELLESYIIQHIETSPEEVVYFSWHGGEPTILGLEYYRRIVRIQREHHADGRRIVNGIQTNGILLNEEWCHFLAKEGFSVGLSLDGPPELHDRYRVTKAQKPTHREVMQSYRLLKQHRIPCDLLCVIHQGNVAHPAQIYRFFKEIGAQDLSFLPVVESRPEIREGISPHTVSARAYGIFLCTVFDEWIRHDIGQIRVQIFEEAARTAAGQEHLLCLFRETCGDIPVLEHNGDFFSCDHFVDAPHRLGTLREKPLIELLESPGQKAFGQAKWDRLPDYCRKCDVLSYCHGGCPKDRFLRTPDGEEGLNYLCQGFKQFFTHSRPYLVSMATLTQAGQPREGVMRLAQLMSAETFPDAGRNNPCPCGSGRKYKKCCGFK
jgi:uncharacterized protein